MIKKISVSMLIIGGLLANLLLPVITASAALSFPKVKLAVAEGYAYGNDEQWHLQPINEKSVFQVHEKVQFFAQVGPISGCHKWKMILNKDNSFFREILSDQLNPAPGTYWNYSNFFPYAEDLNTGDYQVIYFLDIGYGYESLGSVSFTVNEPALPYEYSGAVTAHGFAYGTDDHWNLQPTNPSAVFDEGNNVFILAKAKNVYVKHQWKIELYRKGTTDLLIRNFFSGWNEVGSGWNYSNFYPIFSGATSGEYEYKVYMDTGSGFSLLDTKTFTVSGTIGDYQYVGATTAHDWTYGTDDHWNLQPVNATTTFAAGDKVYLLAKAKNVYVKHQWKVELYRKGATDIMIRNFISGWNEVGSGWNYSNFYPPYDNAASGNYEYKVYINTGSEFKLVDTKSFTVTGETGSYQYVGATTAHGWDFGMDDHWNLQPVNATSTFSAGDKVYMLAKAKDAFVTHMWKIELYRKGTIDQMVYAFTSGWNMVGYGWNYSNFYPAYENALAGNYYYKVFINDGSGFTQLDTKDFVVK